MCLCTDVCAPGHNHIRNRTYTFVDEDYHDQVIIIFIANRPWFIIKMLSCQYRKSHSGDKRVIRSSYLHNGISYTGEMASLYWISPRNWTLCGEWHRSLITQVWGVIQICYLTGVGSDIYISYLTGVGSDTDLLSHRCWEWYESVNTWLVTWRSTKICIYFQN